MRKAFTMIESLFVLFIMMIILMIVIPNVTSKNDVVKDKGCDAMIEMINSQILLYELEYGQLPTSVDELIQANYLKDTQRTCPNGANIMISNGQASSD